ncbi:MAG TPA: hypothetical protein VMU10_12080 [Desulfomonilia bacterium]|nr:hypothetical protein [Desulfomonilia bacterium]
MSDLLKSLSCATKYLALPVCLMCLSCSGSSHHGTVASEDVIQTLDSYNFTLQVFDKSSANLSPLSAELAINSKPAAITIDTSEPITGNYSVKEKKYSINGLPNQFKIAINWDDKSSATFTMQLIDSIVNTGSALPTEGKFRLFSGGNYITVTFVDSPAKGVKLEFGSESQTLTWNQIDDLLKSSTNQWQQEAALTATLVSLLMDQIDLVVSTKECMNKYKFRDGLAVAIPSDTFPPSSVSTTKDNLWLKWTDENKDGKLGQGDSFNWVFDNSWENDSSVNIGELTTGNVDLKKYAESIESRDGRDTLISFGFPKASNAGVFYDNLDIARTLNVTDGFGTSVRLTGGFWIDFKGD